MSADRKPQSPYLAQKSILRGYREKYIRESVNDTWLLELPAPCDLCHHLAETG